MSSAALMVVYVASTRSVYDGATSFAALATDPGSFISFDGDVALMSFVALCNTRSKFLYAPATSDLELCVG